jgi:hypothetical protein
MPLISLVIPTRDRDQTLQYTLQTATEQAFADCEIMVSDAAGRPETRTLVEEAQRRDPRVRYVSPPAKLGMSEHWDFALEQTRGDYIIYMGDDDGILPGALETIAAEIKRRDRPQILTWPQCTYMWPEVPDAFYPGLLSVPLTQPARVGDARRNLPHPPYRLFQMLSRTYPTIYNKSAFSRALIERIKHDSGGRFFRSRIPDVYSGVVASVYVDGVPILGKPLMINAQSVRSNGIAFAQPAGKGDGEAQSFLRESKIEIHPTAGGEMTSLLQVLWWETALQARDAVGHVRPFKLPDPRSVVKSALFAAQAIGDDVNYDKEITILRHIAEVNDFVPAFEGWLALAKRQPMKGRMQRTGYDLKTDAIFIDTVSLGVRTIVDAVKVAAAALELSAGMSKPGWRVRDSWRYYKDYVGKRLSVANVVRYVATRR